MEVETDLAEFMPGSQSCLQNHEWYKHGSCAGMSADAYYALSNHLVALFSQTNFNRYVADRKGQAVTRQELLDVFAQEFGAENKDFLSLRCNKANGESLLGEIQLVLKKDLGQLSSFAEVFPQKICVPKGIVPKTFKLMT